MRGREEQKRLGMLVLWAASLLCYFFGLDVRLPDGCLGLPRCTEAL